MREKVKRMTQVHKTTSTMSVRGLYECKFM